ncbi:MAG: hypothetical protein QM736_06155 [Vicinamibacterales bacterium]
MDGTIYKGGTLFTCTLPFLAQMRELGHRLHVPHQQSLEKLRPTTSRTCARWD